MGDHPRRWYSTASPLAVALIRCDSRVHRVSCGYILLRAVGGLGRGSRAASPFPFLQLRTQSSRESFKQLPALLCRLITFNRVSYRIQPLEAEKQGFQLYAFRGRTPVGGRNLVLGLLECPLIDEGLHRVQDHGDLSACLGWVFFPPVHKLPHERAPCI